MSPSGKVTALKGFSNLPSELSDLSTRNPKGDHGAGIGAQQGNKEAGFRELFQGRQVQQQVPGA